MSGVRATGERSSKEALRRGQPQSLTLWPCISEKNALAVSSDNSNFLDVKESAARLGVSTSWVRRHKAELPSVRVGRLVRFDPQLLSLKFQGTNKTGNRLKSERIVPMFRRYQNGSIIQRGKKGQRMWYGIFRQDVPQPNGEAKRKQVFVRLGPVSEYPNRYMAEELLRQEMNAKPCSQTTFSELVQGWRGNVVPTIKESTANYYNKMLDGTDYGLARRVA
jgi:hypothetical protein